MRTIDGHDITDSMNGRTIDFSKALFAALILSCFGVTLALGSEVDSVLLVGEVEETAKPESTICECLSRRPYVSRINTQTTAEFLQAFQTDPTDLLQTDLIVYMFGYPLSEETTQFAMRSDDLNTLLSAIEISQGSPGSSTILTGGIPGTVRSVFRCTPDGDQETCLFLWSRKDPPTQQDLCNPLSAKLAD